MLTYLGPSLFPLGPSIFGQRSLRDSERKILRENSVHNSKLYAKTKLKFFSDINSFASKVDKRKILEVNGEWKLYKGNKEVNTLTLKEAMLLFLAFGSRSVERSERSSQAPNKH